MVPPLQGFVMNRVQGDYFETLLYKIFVSIDEHTNMFDLASVLQVDLNQVKVLYSGMHNHFPDNAVGVGVVLMVWYGCGFGLWGVGVTLMVWFNAMVWVWL